VPHVIKDGGKVIGNQPGHVTPDSQSGVLSRGSDINKSFQKCCFWQRRNLVGWFISWGMRAR